MYEILIPFLLRFGLVIFFGSNLTLCFSQERVIDSLRTIAEDRDPYVRADALIELARTYGKKNDFDQGLIWCLKARSVTVSLGDSARFIRVERIRGQLLNRLERFRETVEILEKALPVARRHNFQNDYAAILNSLALAYVYQARYSDALSLHFENLAIREGDGDQLGIAIALNNIGVVYYKLKNFEKAIQYYEKALPISASLNRDVETIYANLGLCYNQVGDFNGALQYFERALSVCKSDCEPQVLIDVNFGIGLAQYGLKQNAAARERFATSLSLAEHEGNARLRAENLLYLGRISLGDRQFDQAATELNLVRTLAKQEKYNDVLIEAYKELARLSQLLHSYEQASNYQDLYIHLKDSIYSERLIDNLAKIQTEYAQRENIKTIADNQAVIRQQRYLNIAIAIIAILAGLLILVLQRSNRVSKQVNNQLSEAKETIQQQNKLLEIKNRDLDREVERKTIDLERVNISLKQVNDELDNFIYKTSHDIRGPLASLKGMCNVALMDVTDELALEYLRKLDSTAERLNAILTRLLIINQINNSKLTVSRVNFNKIVDDIILLEKKKGLPQKIEIRRKIEDEATLNLQSDKELVRIVLENLIDNAIKFYNESDRVNSFVEINVATTREGVKARIIDNGIGISESNPGKLFQMFFRASERSEIGGIGLYIVKTATAKIGGKVGLLTTPEGYTEFYVLFPPEPPQPEEGT